MRFLKILGFIWLLPMTAIVWGCYILPFWAFGWLQFHGQAEFLVAMFSVSPKCPSWYSKAWKDWWGWSGPCVVVTREVPDFSGRYARTLDHELRHCAQQFVFGPLHYPLYALCLVVVWILGQFPQWENLHAYYDNPFERDARRAAGQPVNIPRDLWKKGPDDRWPWW